MLRAYKTEIHPTQDQVIKINKTLGVCRFVYNFYIAHNKEQYEKGNKFITAFTFSKWLNNKLIPNNYDYLWIKETSSKATKQAIVNAEKAFKKFFNKKSGFPKFKKKSKDFTGFYLPKNNKTDLTIERHRIKLPTIGWVRLKEFGYLPKEGVKSCTVTKRAGKYFVSVLFKLNDSIYESDIKYSEPIGVDLGLKHFAVISDGKVFNNINKSKSVKILEKRLKREQRRFSRKLKKEGLPTSAKNIEKQRLKLQVIHFRLSNKRVEYVKSVVNSLVKAKPRFIAIEDLNVSGMMRNRHLSKAIQQQMFYYFRQFLIAQCNKLQIEIRIVDRWYPSSKMCHECGSIKNDLKLGDRTYKCGCGTIVDRDFNAALNIRDCKKYKIGGLQPN